MSINTARPAIQANRPAARQAVGSSTVPALIAGSADVNPPNGKTLYLKIDLGIGKVKYVIPPRKDRTGRVVVPERVLYVTVKPMTGVFIPAGYKASSTVDLLIYLPGHKGMYPPRLDATIDEYWSKWDVYRLREEVNRSKKNVILVAPTLGPKSESAQLITPDGFARFLNQVLAALVAYGPHSNLSPSIGNLILAGHSGGGLPLRTIANLRTPSASKIRECWLFDALYSGVDAWHIWITRNKNKQFYSFSLVGNPPWRNSDALAKKLKASNAGKDNAHFIGTRQGNHFTVPKEFLKTMIDESRWLGNRAGEDRETWSWESFPLAPLESSDFTL